MGSQERDRLALSILKENMYMTLATTNGSMPWASPVFYCMDEKFNLYFISLPDSRHVKNFDQTPLVAFAIFDSTQNEGQGNGIQGLGNVKKLYGEELSKGLTHYYTSFIQLDPSKLEDKEDYSLYKISVQELYILDDVADKRVRVLI